MSALPPLLPRLGRAIAATTWFLATTSAMGAGEPRLDRGQPPRATGGWPPVQGESRTAFVEGPPGADGRRSAIGRRRVAAGELRPLEDAPRPPTGEPLSAPPDGSLSAAGASPARRHDAPSGVAASEGEAEASSESVTLRPASDGELRDALGRLAETRLGPLGLHLDMSRARLALSRPLAAGTSLQARPAWPAGIRPQTLPLPLPFELRPLGGGPVLRVSLAAPLHADVWTAGRRVERGERLSCADLRPGRRSLHAWPADAIGLPCRLPAGAVALRRLAAHDVLRHGDLGMLPAVLAERELELVVESGRVALRTRAVALSDARLGETVPVRVPGRPAVFQARVTAPGVAALAEARR